MRKRSTGSASVEICDALTSMEGRPWADWRAGKPLTPNQLARLLKPFGVVSDSVRIGGKTPKGYYRHQFAEVWQRYLALDGVNDPQHRNNATAAGTSTAFQNATPDPDVAFQKCEKPLHPSDCCGVADQKGVNGLDGQTEDRSCRQCGDTLDGTEQQFLVGGNRVWLHPECRRFLRSQQKKGTDNDKAENRQHQQFTGSN